MTSLAPYTSASRQTKAGFAPRVLMPNSDLCLTSDFFYFFGDLIFWGVVLKKKSGSLEPCSVNPALYNGLSAIIFSIDTIHTLDLFFNLNTIRWLCVHTQHHH